MFMSQVIPKLRKTKLKYIIFKGNENAVHFSQFFGKEEKLKALEVYNTNGKNN